MLDVASWMGILINMVFAARWLEANTLIFFPSKRLGSPTRLVKSHIENESMVKAAQRLIKASVLATWTLRRSSSGLRRLSSRVNCSEEAFHRCHCPKLFDLGSSL